MITAGDFKKGITVEWDGGVWTIVDFQHVKPGKGAAFVRTKIKNVMTGAVVERSFNPTDKMPKAILETKEMQYLYNDGDLYYFMDPETYDLIPIGKDTLGDNFRFVKENMSCKINSYKGKIFAVEPPTFVELEFEVHGVRYTVRRNPEYQRPKARGEGMTTEKADATLTYPDTRPPVTKAKDVTATVPVSYTHLTLPTIA